MIALRKEKDKVLQDLIAMDKIDLNALQKAIDEARENIVRPEVITKGEKYLSWLKYCKRNRADASTSSSREEEEKLA